MKHLSYILFLIILLSFKSSDKLTGKFFNHCSNNKIEYYEFNSDGHFDYFAGCEYKIYGHGNYQLKKDKLLLKYLTLDSDKKGRFEIWGYKIANQYSDTIHLRIQGTQKQELFDGVTVHYLDSQIGGLATKNGEIKIARLNKDLIVSKLGYKDLTIPKDKILEKGILGFNVFLQDWQISFKENITDTIDFKKLGLDTLTLDNCVFVKNIESKNIIICE